MLWYVLVGGVEIFYFFEGVYLVVDYEGGGEGGFINFYLLICYIVLVWIIFLEF